jgi:hypothetical protein
MNPATEIDESKVRRVVGTVVIVIDVAMWTANETQSVDLLVKEMYRAGGCQENNQQAQRQLIHVGVPRTLPSDPHGDQQGY